MNCPKCGAVINNQDAKFCGSCGNDLSTPVQIPEKEETEILEVEPAQPTMVATSPVVEQSEPQAVMNQQPNIQQNQNIQTNQPVVNNGSQAPKKSNKTLFIIIGAIIAVIVIVIASLGIINLIGPSDKQQEQNKINAIFNPDNPIKVKKGDKYGYINTDGEFIIDATYDTASDFEGDYAVVRAEVEVNGLKKTVYQIIDQKGKVKKQAELGIEYLNELNLWVIDSELYNSSMKKISPENVKVSHEEDEYFIWVDSTKNTGGIMNAEGRQTYTYQFQDDENYISIEPSDNDDDLKERYCTINIENEKYAIVNCDTGVVVQDYTEYYVSEQGDNIYKLKDHKTWDVVEVMYIQGDKKVYTSTNTEISLYYYPGYVSIRDGSKSYSERYTYLDTKTLEITTTKPSTTTETTTTATNEWETFTNNKKFSCTTGYGLMNDAQITLPCEWDYLEYLEINLYKYLKENNKNYIYGKKDNKWYLIDLETKKAIIEFNASYITPKSQTTFIYYTDKDTNNKKVYNLLSGNSLNVDSSKTLSIYSNYVTVKDTSEKTLKYYNTSLKLIYTENL